MDPISYIYNRLLSVKFTKQFIDRYFYSRSSIHYRMLEDQVRMNAYKRAIEQHVKPDDVVLDIGCGIGILSFLAAKNGCKKIYAVDNSPIIKHAEKIAKNNGLEDKIKFYQKDLFSLKLKCKVDVLLHEAIGAFVFDENLIKLINYAKKNFLKDGGRILPNKIDIFLAPVSYGTEIHKEIDFWSKRQHGLEFKNMLELSMKNNISHSNKPIPIILQNKDKFLAEEKIICTIDLNTESEVPKHISVSFDAKKSDKLTGFCGFFKIYFDKQNYISTTPQIKNTHWLQFFLPIYKTIFVKDNEKLNLELTLDENIGKWKWNANILNS